MNDKCTVDPERKGEIMFSNFISRLINWLIGENRLNRLINAMEGGMDYELD